MISAKVIEDSISPAGARLTTFQLMYPRFIHGELLTHRDFSRNAASSRAIPVAKMIEQVRTNPAMPIHWGKNQPGMQAHEELDEAARESAIYAWKEAAHIAADIAERMNRLGAHKQVVNRTLEPFQWMQTVVTATEFDNFFELRLHKDAQPEIQRLAWCMADSMSASIPWERELDRTSAYNWHLPYVSADERFEHQDNPELLAKASGARCARTSYLTHDGADPVIEKDLGLYDRLVGSRPIHASPTEHQGYPLRLATAQSKNFRGWRQWRERVEHEIYGVAA